MRFSLFVIVAAFSSCGNPIAPPKPIVCADVARYNDPVLVCGSVGCKIVDPGPVTYERVCQ